MKTNRKTIRRPRCIVKEKKTFQKYGTPSINLMWSAAAKIAIGTVTPSRSLRLLLEENRMTRVIGKKVQVNSSVKAPINICTYGSILAGESQPAGEALARKFFTPHRKRHIQESEKARTLSNKIAFAAKPTGSSFSQADNLLQPDNNRSFTFSLQYCKGTGLSYADKP